MPKIRDESTVEALELPKIPERAEQRERYLKKHQIGRYNPNFEPLIPYGYIAASEAIKKANAKY